MCSEFVEEDLAWLGQPADVGGDAADCSRPPSAGDVQRPAERPLRQR